ncbi:DUF4344 domain-containing metallopeptidase [Undibacterium sp. MH2W]|uniref:DUF4344 domain-containing metallopeptidase n=1 Tax=Undibacterium sp. MH2W TaxID=3413044 RepID=UPI003BF1CC9B
MFNRIFAAAILILCCISSHAQSQLPFAELLWKGQAVPFYGNAQTQRQGQILEAVRRSNLAERMVSVVNNSVRLHHNLGIGFTSCGNPNAFFDRSKSAIVFCLEMVELIADLAKEDEEIAMKLDKTEFARTIDGAIWGIFFHELGHAVIGVNNVPVTGREEDVADQFAVFYAVNFIEPQNIPVILPTIWLFRLMERKSDIASANQDQLKRLMSDEHSLDMQRVFNLACWAYGANSSRGAVAANFVKLPQERGARCPNEWATVDYGLRSRFKKYFRNQR